MTISFSAGRDNVGYEPASDPETTRSRCLSKARRLVSKAPSISLAHNVDRPRRVICRMIFWSPSRGVKRVDISAQQLLYAVELLVDLT